MKAHLLYRDRDLEPDAAPSSTTGDLVQDLELDALLDAMAAGDPFLRATASSVLLSGLRDADDIRYRQQIVADCLAQRSAVLSLYDLAVEAIERERRIFGGFLHSPSTVLHSSVSALEMFVEVLERLRACARASAGSFRSEGLRSLVGMLEEELDDEYFDAVRQHLEQLRFRDGVLVSARLGPGNRGADYVLRSPLRRRGWLARLGLPDGAGQTLRISDRDESGIRALSDLRDQGIAPVAGALGRSAAHVLDFFRHLRTELGFYLACANLHEAITRRGAPVCFPVPDPTADALSCRGLRDVALVLTAESTVVGNDVDADGRRLVVVTGANQGGKSTFLRSVGLAQLMMQSGMFVGATSFRASVGDRVLTHFKREEDASMRSGKLDEELRRMSDVVGEATPTSLVLCNESFASTNEREGSEIARQVVRALLESGVRVVFVTHLYDLSHGWYRQRVADTLFLRADREADGSRTFALTEGEPLPTSFGEDLYRRVFRTGARPGPGR